MNRTLATLFVAALGVSLAASAARAQVYALATLYQFTGADDGSHPAASVTLSADGNILYGTTSDGGANGDGIVFSVPVTGGSPSILATFNSTDGAHPDAALTLRGDTLYGTTDAGGTNGVGTIFSVPTAGGSLTTLASFSGDNGASPTAKLTFSADGKTLYGAASSGGDSGNGTVFSLPATGGAIATLATFTGANGATPLCALTLSADGKTLYGTTSEGGADGDGTVFSVPSAGGSLTTLAAFNKRNGSHPDSPLTFSDDGKTLYGTTSYGGLNDDGEVFSVPTGGGAPTIIAKFTGINGASPSGKLTLSANGATLYGATFAGAGADSFGTLFSVPVTGGMPVTLVRFNSDNGAHPIGGLTLGTDTKTLYGAARRGGANNDGVVFALKWGRGAPRPPH